MGKFTLLKLTKQSQTPSTQPKKQRSSPQKEQDSSPSSPSKPSVLLEGKQHHTMYRNMMSLGTGSLSSDMSTVDKFEPTITIKFIKRVDSERTLSTSELSGTSSDSSENLSATDRAPPMEFIREKCSFLRVSDLDMPSSSDNDDGCSEIPNFHHPATDAPHGVKHDSKELWIALNDGTQTQKNHASPIAHLALEKLAEFGLSTCLDNTMWSPDAKTQKLLRNSSDQQQWMNETFKAGSVDLTNCPTPNEKEVLIWTGHFKHGKYGSDLPAIRAAGLINMSAKSLMELMVDSNRVKEYNKFSLGRHDLMTFQDDINSVDGPFAGSITKVMKSCAKPPMVRKTIEFVSILRAQPLADGSGYLVVSRAVEQPEEGDSKNATMKSEILLGVNVIRTVKGHEDTKCIMINVNHINSPMIPMMLAKRIGLSSAVSFLNDVRGAAA